MYYTFPFEILDIINLIKSYIFTEYIRAFDFSTPHSAIKHKTLKSAFILFKCYEDVIKTVGILMRTNYAHVLVDWFLV